MERSSTYLTQAPIQEKDNSLRSYVNNLQSKLDYAKWKQNLVLNYNYMPLSIIKEKLENDRISHIKKMQSQQARLRALVESEELRTLLRNFSEYKIKLQKDILKTEVQIDKQKIILQELKKKVQQKVAILKKLKQQNINAFSSKLQQKGVTSARDLRSYKKSISLTKASSIRKIVSQLQPEKQKQYSQRIRQNDDNYHKQNINALYQSCIKTIQKTVQQKGKQKKQNQFLIVSGVKEDEKKYSSVQQKKKSGREGLKMSWELFQNLPFPQLLQNIYKHDPFGDAFMMLIK